MNASSSILCALLAACACMSARAATPEPAGENAPEITPGFFRASDLRGLSVVNLRNEPLGVIRDLAVNLEHGDVPFLVLAAGGFLGIGERLHAIPPHVLAAASDKRRLILRAGIETLQADAGFDRQSWPSSAPLWAGTDLPPDAAQAATQPAEDRRAAVQDQSDRPEADAGIAEAAGAELRVPQENDLFFRASELFGVSVRNPQGESLGAIRDLAIDLETGSLRYAVLAHGGFLGMGEKLYAVPPGAFKRPPTGRNVLLLGTSLEALAKAESFSPTNWPAEPGKPWRIDKYQFHGENAPAIHEPAGSQTNPAVPSDREITQIIRRRLMNDESLSFTAKNAAIHVAQGVVTLRGTVHSEEEIQRMAGKAREIHGVRLVNLELELRPKSPPSDPTSKP